MFATITELEALLHDLAFRDWRFIIIEIDEQQFLKVVGIGYDLTRGGIAVKFSGRPWRVSVHMTKSEVVQTAFKAVMTAMEHEIRESFLYRGRPIFDPHYDVEKLWELRGPINEKYSLDTRE